MDVDMPDVNATPTTPATSSSNPGSNEKDDPVVASFPVYMNAAHGAARRLVVLEHPNRKVTSQGHAEPPVLTGVRLKPRTGMLEVDAALSHAHADYDRDKGLRWGAALSRSLAAKHGGSHGLAGGFGVGVPPIRGGGGRRKAEDDPDRVLDMADWAEAVRQDKVLRTQTLGGQFPPATTGNGAGGGDTTWTVASFQGNSLHLTPATAVIPLRPQLHHLDAQNEQDRQSRPRDAASGSGGATSSAAGKDGAGPGNQQARAITMTIKSASSNQITQETMTDRLRLVQTEPWSPLRYEAEDSNRAWDLYSQSFVYRAPEGGEGVAASRTTTSVTGGSKVNLSASSKGKGKEKATADNDASDETAAKAQETETEELLRHNEAHARRLSAEWKEPEFLSAVGRPKDNGPTIPLDGIEEIDDDVNVKKEGGTTTSGGTGATRKMNAAGSSATTAAKGKGRAGASSASTSRRGGGAAGRGKSVAFKAGATQIN